MAALSQFIRRFPLSSSLLVRLLTSCNQPEQKQKNEQFSDISEDESNNEEHLKAKKKGEFEGIFKFYSNNSFILQPINPVLNSPLPSINFTV